MAPAYLEIVMLPALIPFARGMDFTGRSRRSELWPFALLYGLSAVMAMLLDAAMGRSAVIGGLAGPVTIIIGLMLALPLVAVMVRRLHDIGRSGGWVVLALVPVVGLVWLAAWLAVEGDRGPNAYGPDPKAAPRGSTPLAGLFGA